jgi:Tfp pilus assembly protein PilX
MNCKGNVYLVIIVKLVMILITVLAVFSANLQTENVRMNVQTANVLDYKLSVENHLVSLKSFQLINASI